MLPYAKRDLASGQDRHGGRSLPPIRSPPVSRQSESDSARKLISCSPTYTYPAPAQDLEDLMMNRLSRALLLTLPLISLTFPGATHSAGARRPASEVVELFNGRDMSNF